MREIKFRAWDTTSKKMYPQNKIEDFTLEQVYRLVITSDPYTKIMQFTGLQDINGVDIYEGDIVHIVKDRFGKGWHEVWSVEYGYFGDAAFYVQNQVNSGRIIEFDGESYFYIDGKKQIPLKVIGNIHENPEVIK